jgi:hypothetical protein
MFKKMLPAALSAALCAGCATIFTGTSDNLQFDSNVPGTRLSVDGQHFGVLPITINMSRNFVGGKHFHAHFEADGFLPQDFDLNREFNTVAILDITDPLTCGGIDVLTGSLMKFSPTAYHVQMLPQGQGADDPRNRRSLEAVRFGLFNRNRLQQDLARGGGRYLTSFAAVVAPDDAAAQRMILELSLRNAEALIDAPTPPAFVARFDDLLGDDAQLSRYRIE